MDEKEILLLIEKLQSGTISPEELKRLRAFLHTTSDAKPFLRLMREKYDEISYAADDLPPYENEAKTKERLMQHIQQETPLPRKRTSLYYWMAGVAAISLFVLSFLFFQQKQSPSLQEHEWVTVSTQHGERKEVTLHDGSTIQLNGNTTLSYPKQISTSVRPVRLDGEAFFDIAKDETKPFLVISTEFTTQVVGTSFNIDTDISKVIEVNTGEVHVFAMNDAQTLTLLRQNSENILQDIETAADEKIALPYGKRAQLSDANTWEISTYHHQNWVDNKLVYLEEPLSQVLKKAYRNYGDSVAVDPALANTKITITFQEKKKEQVLNTLVELCNGTLTQDPETNIWKITK